MDSQSTCCAQEGPSDNYIHRCNMTREIGCHHQDLEVQQVWCVAQAPCQIYLTIFQRFECNTILQYSQNTFNTCTVTLADGNLPFDKKPVLQGHNGKNSTVAIYK